MAKLHELLAAEKTPTGAWNELLEGTKKKFHNPEQFYSGYSKYLIMVEESSQNAAVEAAAREEKPVITTVYDTLEYALDLFARSEDLQYQKNATNRKATGTVMWDGKPLLVDMPVDELLGLEARLTKLREELFKAMPTLDASKHWVPSAQGERVWEVKYPEDTTKTDKQLVPITLKEATKEHPAQVQAVTKDIVVGKYTTIKRSGAATALQKAESLKRLDNLIVEIKQARMRANETEATNEKIASKIVDLILEPLKNIKE
jgi:hypothetical protein